jgi:hypothetical protein
VAFVFASCLQSAFGEPYVHQIIPIQIQTNVTVKIKSLSGNGDHCVGIRCSSEIWNVLTNGAESITANLKSSDKKETRIGGIIPGYKGSTCDSITNVHYLFVIGGERHANAVVEITFPNLPKKSTRAEIVVTMTPADTDSPF